MENFKKDILQPLIGGVGASAAVYSIYDNKKQRRQTQKQNEKNNEARINARNLKNTLKIREGLNTNLLTEKEARHYCKLNNLNPAEVIDSIFNNDQNNSLLKNPRFSENPSSRLGSSKNSSKSNGPQSFVNYQTNNFDKIQLKQKDKYLGNYIQTKEGWATQAVDVIDDYNYTLDDDIQIKEKWAAETADIVADDHYTRNQDLTCTVQVIPNPVFNVSTSSKEFSPLQAAALAGLLTTAAIIAKNYIFERLKKKSPTLKKILTSREEYFLESHEQIHKKLDLLITKKNNDFNKKNND